VKEKQKTGIGSSLPSGVPKSLVESRERAIEGEGMFWGGQTGRGCCQGWQPQDVAGSLRIFSEMGKNGQWGMKAKARSQNVREIRNDYGQCLVRGGGRGWV